MAHDLDMAAWASLPRVRRAGTRHNASCHGGVGSAVDRLVTVQHTVERVLVVDASCACECMGIGNQFGDYSGWFATAALSSRALFIDWIGSASRLQCSRCAGRSKFELARHFGAGRPGYSADVAGWRWSPRARARVVARHGAAAEKVLAFHAERRGRVPQCLEMARALSSSSAWLTVQLQTDWVSLAAACNASGRRATWPDADARALLLRGLAARLGPTSEPGAGALPSSAAALLRAAARHQRLSQTEQLWETPLRLTDTLGRAADLQGPLRELLTPDAAFFADHALVAARLERWRRQQPPAAEQLLARLTACATDAMLQPQPALRAALLPVLREAGERSVVALQVRTGWGDEAAHLSARLGMTPAALQRLRATRAAGGGDGGGGGGEMHQLLVEDLAPGAPAHALLVAPDASAAAERRWAALTALDCRDQNRPLKFRSCLSPSPVWLEAASARGERALRRLHHKWDATLRASGGAVALAGAGHSRFGHSVQCAARVAQSLAAERAVPARGSPEGGRDETDEPVAAGPAAAAAAAASAADGWSLFVASDSVAMRGLLSHLPPLRGHVLGPAHAHAHAQEAQGGAGGAAQPSRHAAHAHARDFEASATSLALAADLYMVAAADHALSASDTTMQFWATRAIEQRGRPHLLGCHGEVEIIHAAGRKSVPVCNPATCVSGGVRYCPCDAVPFEVERLKTAEGRQCTALRFATLSEAAASVFQGASAEAGTALRHS